jgi:GTP-binding protein SAR1
MDGKKKNWVEDKQLVVENKRKILNKIKILSMWGWVGRLIGFVSSAKNVATTAAWTLWNGVRNRRRLLLVGLDNSGKSTLGHLLEKDLLIATEPTMHPLTQQFILGNTEFETLDLGGHKEALRLWKTYYRASLDGILFMVDVAAPDRFSEAAKQLAEILTSNATQQIPVAIIGNKIDAKGAVGEDVLAQALHIQPDHDTNNGGTQRLIKIFMVSVVKRFNHTAPFLWISQLPKT